VFGYFFQKNSENVRTNSLAERLIMCAVVKSLDEPGWTTVFSVSFFANSQACAFCARSREMALRYQQNDLNALVTDIVNLATDVLRAGPRSMRERFSCGQEQMRQLLRGGWSGKTVSGEMNPAPAIILPNRVSHPGFVGNCG
jgi:hypothetical protein